MKKIKTNLHSLNKHIFLGFSFCVFALIVSIYWGLTYAEDTSLLSTSPLTNTSATITPTPTTNDPSLSVAPTAETIISTNQCTELKLTLTDNKTNYYIGDIVHYAWTCNPASTYNYISIFLQKPDKTNSNINNATGTAVTTYGSFDTSNFVAGSYTLKACLSTSCSPNYPSSSQSFSLVAKTVTAPTDLTATVTGNNVVLNWLDKSDNEAGFKIYRGPTWTDIGNVGPNVTTFTDSNRPAGTYTYKLNAFSSSNIYSPVSNEVSATINSIPTVTPSEGGEKTTTNISSGGILNDGVVSTIPIAPTGLSLSTGTILSETSKFIPLKWTDNSTNEDKWNIERGTKSGMWMFLNQIKGANVTYYADYSAVPGISYDYRVQACLSGTGCSSYSTIENLMIPLPKVLAPVPSVEKSTTETPTITQKKEEVVTTIKTSIENNTDTGGASGPVATEALSISNKDIAETLNVISQSPVINEKIKTEIANVEESSKVVKLVYQDTNKDGISDYESKYVYNIDPVKKSPTSVYEGKTITAADKILLGFDPSKKELVKVVKQEPIASTAPIVNTYKVNKVELIKGQNKVVLKGQALPNSFITLYVYSTPIVVTVKTDSRGEWQYLLDKELENGTHTVYTATVNNTGNIIAQSSPYSFTKTAEAASLKDIPVAGASVGVEKPEFLSTKNIFMIVISIVLITGIILTLIGLFTRKDVPTSSN